MGVTFTVIDTRLLRLVVSLTRLLRRKAIKSTNTWISFIRSVYYNDEMSYPTAVSVYLQLSYHAELVGMDDVIICKKCVPNLPILL